MGKPVGFSKWSGSGGRGDVFSFGHKEGQCPAKIDENKERRRCFCKHIVSCAICLVCAAIGIGYLIFGVAGLLSIAVFGQNLHYNLVMFICGIGGIYIIFMATSGLVGFLRQRVVDKRAELSDIVSKCRQHPNKDIQDVVREAVRGARYWTFKKVWKKIRDSHDYGTIFTGIFR